MKGFGRKMKNKNTTDKIKATFLKQGKEYLENVGNIEGKVKETIILEENYYQINQSPPTNLLRQSITNDYHGVIDAITGTTNIVVDNLTVTLDPPKPNGINNKNKESLATLTPLDHMLLDLLVSKYLLGNKDSNGVFLNLEEYIELRGGMDKRTARKQVNNSLNNIYSISLEFSPINSSHSYISTRVLSSKGVANEGKSFIENNIIYAGFSPEFLRIIDQGFYTSLPKSVLRVNFRYHPNAYHIATALAVHKRTNMGKDKDIENRMKVKTLLGKCPNLPTYEHVMQGNRNVTERIISRFLRDLGTITELSYIFVDPNKNIVEHEDVETIPYKDFINLTLVITNWKNFPKEEEYQKNARKQREKYKAIREKKNKAK